MFIYNNMFLPIKWFFQIFYELLILIKLVNFIRLIKKVINIASPLSYVV